jgi:hypothetical protein
LWKGDDADPASDGGLAAIHPVENRSTYTSSCHASASSLGPTEATGKSPLANARRRKQRSRYRGGLLLRKDLVLRT